MKEISARVQVVRLYFIQHLYMPIRRYVHSPTSHRPVKASHSHPSSVKAFEYPSTACSGAFPLCDNVAIMRCVEADVEEGYGVGRSRINRQH